MKSAFSFLSAFSICLAALLFAHCGPQPIVITSPAAGAKLLAGDTISVQWTPSITSPKLSYNYHLASSVWDTFATIIPVNSQEAKVALPAMWWSDSFQIKVEDNGGTHDAGVSGYLHLKYIILTTALTGRTVKVGDSITLSWRVLPALISSVEAMLSTDSGKSPFREIINTGSIPVGTALSCIWVVGSETPSDSINFFYPTSGCIVKVRKYSSVEDGFIDLSGIFTVTNP
jgi:hypothetical protein